eukprot:TRINITY_DN9875_c0_g1_i1.p1 TRINITY_DN9875_c0_g1~~TRINITY_DN9875_c0_g1_i1.p1  ORF type:complete len:287 (-),score=46.30 TRINITY_DN9875_c0_g1_i1:312-1172(-)
MRATTVTTSQMHSHHQHSFGRAAYGRGQQGHLNDETEDIWPASSPSSTASNWRNRPRYAAVNAKAAVGTTTAAASADRNRSPWRVRQAERNYLPLQLQIVGACGVEERRVQARVDRFSTVEAFKDRNFARELRDEGLRIRLIYAGQILNDTDTFSRVPSNSVIQCHFLEDPSCAGSPASRSTSVEAPDDDDANNNNIPQLSFDGLILEAKLQLQEVCEGVGLFSCQETMKQRCAGFLIWLLCLLAAFHGCPVQDWQAAHAALGAALLGWPVLLLTLTRLEGRRRDC